MVKKIPECRYPACLEESGQCGLCGGREDSRLSELCRTRADYRWLWAGKPELHPGRTAKQWAYGVTVSPRKQRTLGRTMASLANAGFPRPHLFVDGDIGEIPSGYDVTQRMPSVGAWAHWFLSLGELVLREPLADFYALFQDDVLLASNLREHLEAINLPDDGYLNLFTEVRNERYTETGFHPARGRGLGAQALVFTKEQALIVLADDSSYERVRKSRGKKNIDGAVYVKLGNRGHKEYVHHPSLAQHIGHTSTLGHDKVGVSVSFPGEDYNATNLANAAPTRTVATDKLQILLSGYNTASGLGYLHRDVARWLPVRNWLILKHQRFPMLDIPEDVDAFVCQSAKAEKVTRACRGCNVFLFAENPFFGHLLPLVKQEGLRTVCVPMLEWTPTDHANAWTRFVDLFLCPTKQCYDTLSDEGLPCEYLPWPVDTTEFSFKKRDACRRFLFINGNGGWDGRKGGREFAEAMRILQRRGVDASAIVYNQTNKSGKAPAVSFPSNCEVRGSALSRAALYRDGDVLIYPAHNDGIGLQVLEAMACGLPVVATDAPPYTEHDLFRTVKCDTSEVKAGRTIAKHVPRPEALADVMESLMGVDVSEPSRAAREYAETRSWAAWVEQVELMVQDVQSASLSGGSASPG